MYDSAASSPPTPPAYTGTTLYLAPIVHSLSVTELEIVPSALLCVVEGRIAWVEKNVAAKDVREVAARKGVESDAQVVVLDEGFLCPGFIDTHTHAPQYPNNGLGSELQLLDWLTTLTFPLEEHYADAAFARKVYEQVVARNLASGTTTACYYGTIHETTTVLADVCHTSGQRALIGRCSMDRLCPDSYIEKDCAASMAATHSFLDHFKVYDGDDLVRPILTPRFALSCTPGLLTALGDLAAERDLPIQTHISENHAEIAEIKRLFPDQNSYADVYAAHGLLRRGTILAHAVHLDDEQRTVIAKSGAGVSHCPSSNNHLNSGAARVLSMLDAGIPVGLGTDCSGGPALGLLPSLRAAGTTSRILAFEKLTPRGLSVAELFYLATRGGADLCRMDDVGNFTPGSQFDALWIRPRSPGMWVQPGEPVEQVFEKFIFAGDDRDIASVWVRGRRVAGAAPVGV